MAKSYQFLKASAEKARDNVHRRKILKAITTYESKVNERKRLQFRDWSKARQQAAQVKDYVLAHLPDLLETFEENISSRGAKVLWAEDSEEARKHFESIVRTHGSQKIVKAKSMATEEIELNEMLQGLGLEVSETDLGEMIVQLAGEKPYHIITPAMHKSRQDIAELFHEKLGTPKDAEAETLTAAAREYLRQSFVTADLGVSGANFLVADEGAVVQVENEGNARLTMACPPVLVVLVGIEKVLPRFEDLKLFLPLLATSGTGQAVTCYNNILRGPKRPEELDGPEHLYVILLDNGRSRLYDDAQFRVSLRCIRCGACINSCPVYRTIGGHTYGTTYQGPIGSVITPHLRDLGQWQHLAYASSLCGACSNVCPVEIEIHRLLLENRVLAVERPGSESFWKAALSFWSFLYSSRMRLNIVNRLSRLGVFFKFLLPRGKRKRIPPMPRKSFGQLWKEHENSRKNS